MTDIETVPELLRRKTREGPDVPFIFFKDQVWTRREMDEASDRIAGRLIASSIRPGDRVGLLMGNCPEFVAFFFGILKAGAVAVPVNAWLKEPEIVYCLKDSGASGLILGPAHHALAENLLLQCPTLKFAQKAESPMKEELLRGPRPGALPEVRAGDLADIIYTSGTTGFPKGAILTHANWLANARGIAEGTGMTASDRVLGFLPLFHVNGQGVALLGPLSVGASTVLMEKFAPKEFFDLLSRHRCTTFSGVPSIYNVLLNLPEASRYDLSSLRFCICAAAPMPVDVFERFEAKFKAHILEGYGLSEGTCAASLNPPPPGPRKIGSIGVTIPGHEMRIFDDNDVRLPDGKVGEIVFRGPSVMTGYWNKPEATEAALKGGWLHTGDLGYRDPDGYFYIVGRKKEMIIRGGENVYPKEIEELLYKHPAVSEAAVIGLPDRRYGEEVAAFIVLKEGAACTAKDLAAYLKDKLADYKTPRRIEFVPAFPKTATGKIQKLKLRDSILAAAGI